MRWILWSIVLTTSSVGCITTDEYPNLNFDIGSLTPVHCEGGHRPVHCGIGNQTVTTPAGMAYANYSIGGRPVPRPYPLSGAGTLEIQLAFRGEGSESVNVTVGVDEVGGIEWTGASNETRTLGPGETAQVSFPFEPAKGWPNGDLIFPRLALGVETLDGARWSESHLYVVMARGK